MAEMRHKNAILADLTILYSQRIILHVSVWNEGVIAYT